MSKKVINSVEDPEILAKLLKIGSVTKKHPGQPVAKKKKLLKNALAEVLPFNTSLFNSPSPIFVYLCKEAGSPSGKGLEAFLTELETPLEALKRIKDYFKRKVKAALSGADHDVAAAIYYASIASALVFHGKKISKFTYEDLHQSFVSYGNKKWISPKLVKLFKRASTICQGKI